MAYKININKRFEIKVARVYEYLFAKWGVKVADNFYEKLIDKINQLEKQPDIGLKSKKKENIRSVLIKHYTRIYYRVEKNQITLINIFDTRSDPNKNPYK